jgi:hypothetical protein
MGLTGIIATLIFCGYMQNREDGWFDKWIEAHKEPEPKNEWERRVKAAFS